MGYPAKRKAAILQKMLPPNNKPIAQLAKEEGIAQVHAGVEVEDGQRPQLRRPMLLTPLGHRTVALVKVGPIAALCGIVHRVARAHVASWNPRLETRCLQRRQPLSAPHESVEQFHRRTWQRHASCPRRIRPCLVVSRLCVPATVALDSHVDGDAAAGGLPGSLTELTGGQRRVLRPVAEPLMRHNLRMARAGSERTQLAGHRTYMRRTRSDARRLDSRKGRSSLR